MSVDGSPATSIPAVLVPVPSEPVACLSDVGVVGKTPEPTPDQSVLTFWKLLGFTGLFMTEA